MRILLLMDPFLAVPPRHYGGIERVIADLADGLMARGHDVTLWAAPGSGTRARLEPFGREQEWTRWSNLRNTALVTARFLPHPRRFDVIHNFGRLAYLSAILRRDVPKVQTYMRRVNPENMRRTVRAGARRLHFTAVSAAIRDTGAPGGGAWSVIYNCAPIGRYTLDADTDPRSAPLVFLGRLERCKGVHTAIAVARRLNRPLVLAGNVSTLPEEIAYFHELVEPQIDGSLVSYVGPVDDQQKNTLLRRAAAMLLPIEWEEPFPVVLPESLLCGTPVIAFRRGGVPEGIAHGRTGFVCDTLDEMVAAVGRLGEISRIECRAEAERRFSDAVITSERAAGTPVFSRARREMRRVLMIAPHFPPDSTAATHRVRLLAPHLADHGWEPTIVTVDARDYEGRLDPALAESVPGGLRVIRARAWPSAVSRRFGFGDLGLRAFTGLKRAAASALAAAPFDAFFITIYPSYPALLGPWLKKRFGVPFVIDYQDPWVGEWGRTAGPHADGGPDLRSRASRFLSARLEPLALGAADGVTAVSRETFEQALARNPGARPVATEEIPIGWDRRDLEFLRASRRGASRIVATDGLVHLAYVGTLLPTGHETLRALLTAAARLRASDPAAAARLRFRFFGTGNQRSADAPARVPPMARELGVADLVTEEPERLDYFAALQTLVDSTAILLLGTRERHYTPSKVFPALMSERPILAVGHDASTATALLRRAGRPPAVRLVSYDDEHPAQTHVDEIACALKQLAAAPRMERAEIDTDVLAPSSAGTLAARLAGVLDRVSRGPIR